MYAYEMKQRSPDLGAKLDIIKQQFRKTLKENGLCCCAADGSFSCNNCVMVMSGLMEKRPDNCPNCQLGTKLRLGA